MTNDYDSKENYYYDTCAETEAECGCICEQDCINPVVIPCGEVYVKIPVVLAEAEVTIPIEAVIKLDKKAIEIKRIKKNVFLTQCRLIPFSDDHHDKEKCTGILSISGFIRKNIEYATEGCVSKDKNVCGDIRHCTVKVPFHCITKVKFFREPFFCKTPTSEELEFFTEDFESNDICAEPVIGKDPCLQTFTSTEIFNEDTFCELEKACITEIDIHKCAAPLSKDCCESSGDHEFKEFKEKIVLKLTVKVLQKQQVRLCSLGKPDKKHGPCCEPCIKAPQCPYCEGDDHPGPKPPPQKPSGL